ncbi:MAG TPA: hypothetical protein VME01_05145 [Solirubrobacteraceae bacterium]|nr:hypothetical protein [Solirubrobacteraceae bacterium]
MTDTPEDPTEVQTSETQPGPPVDESLDSWSESSEQPTWTPIDVESENPAADAIKPAAGPNPYAAIPQGEPVPAAPAGRRPSSLRAALDERLPNVPRRSLTPPPLRHNQADSPASAAASAPAPAPAVSAATSRAAEPKAHSGPGLPERIIVLVNERPEVAIGVAFVGGLLLATILKRLGRR